MSIKNFGTNLRMARTAANKSVSDVSQYLISRNIKASEKTIYSWEAGRSQPTPDALLLMCEYYHIDDILATFGYKSKTPAPEGAGGVDGIADYLTREFERLGIIEPGGDLSDKDLAFMISMVDAIRAHFDKKD